jgi:hypothetical protein
LQWFQEDPIKPARCSDFYVSWCASTRVFLDGRFLCDTVPLDRLRNASRRRRRNLGEPDPTVEPTGIDPLAQILEAHYERTRPLAPNEDDRGNRNNPNPHMNKEN